MKWFDAHNDPDPPSGKRVWVCSNAGTVAIGWFEGWAWNVDGNRLNGLEERVWYWANIEYPEGPES